jgi:hypothetical protein
MAKGVPVSKFQQLNQSTSAEERQYHIGNMRNKF